jgi:flavin reductase (DIM6/NTAB) family NADH-FMN oxidoreductase RutF
MNATSPQELFRDVIGHFATGVTIVTTSEAGVDHGTTVSAVSSVSLEPPMLLICLNRSSRTQAVIERKGSFAVNILGVTQDELARTFATGRDDKFAGLEVVRSAAGHPLLVEALAHVECRVVDTAVGGTHTIYFGEVERAERFEGEPLLYFRGRFGWLSLDRDE